MAKHSSEGETTQPPGDPTGDPFQVKVHVHEHPAKPGEKEDKLQKLAPEAFPNPKTSSISIFKNSMLIYEVTMPDHKGPSTTTPLIKISSQAHISQEIPIADNVVLPRAQQPPTPSLRHLVSGGDASLDRSQDSRGKTSELSWKPKLSNFTNFC